MFVTHLQTANDANEIFKCSTPEKMHFIECLHICGTYIHEIQ